jgi:uncharacterized phage protein (TIGR02218 family)
VTRLQGAFAEQIWAGYVTSMSCNAGVAKFRVPSRTLETMQRMLPVHTVGRTCPFILYSAGTCRVDRTAFIRTATVIYTSGKIVRVDMAASKEAPWARHGELLHLGSGERQTIALQTDLNPGFSTVADLTLALPIPELRTGDVVRVYAGCDHTVETCREKFANQRNYGGLPELPAKNPFSLNGFGIYEEE